jgi:hypothetical protein
MKVVCFRKWIFPYRLKNITRVAWQQHSNHRLQTKMNLIILICCIKIQMTQSNNSGEKEKKSEIVMLQQ